MGDIVHINGSNGEDLPAGLKIIVIGAGIGGLAAAINLAKQGHSVTIYESSRFATELGAAIHIPPNVYGLLERMGIDIPGTGANLCEKLVWYTSAGHSTGVGNIGETSHLWQHPWVLGHRVTLHNALKDAALQAKVELKLSSPVQAVDAEHGTVVLQDGTQQHANVIVGADGVHSTTRKYVPGATMAPKSSGKSAFRFLIPRQKVLDDPQTAKYVTSDGTLSMIMHSDRRMVMYQTSNNTLLNFVCIHPESETAGSSSGEWNNETSREMLLDVYRDFHEDFRAILAKVDENSLKLWRLLDMDLMPSWTTGSLALLGDAVHPFLPHQGQGGAVAIEDAVALGVVLDRGLKSEQVRERLELYQHIRKERADKLQYFTRISGEDLKPGEVTAVDYRAITAYNFGHDEFDNSIQRLREWKWSKQPAAYWRMPTGFGPAPGPRQNVYGQPHDGSKSKFITSSIKFRTSRTVLQNLLPPGSKQWKFASPATNAYATISQTTLDGMEWLGGRGYNLICLLLHGVLYTGASGGKPVMGTYMACIMENLSDPITTGREELGMPKVYSEIERMRGNTSQIVKTTWRGAEWGSFEWTGLAEIKTEEQQGIMGGSGDFGEGILSARYLPAVGMKNRGRPECEGVVLDRFADATLRPVVTRVLRAQTASISFQAGSEQSLPTLHYITSRLAEIPIYEVVDAKITEGLGVADLSHVVAI